MKLKMLFFVIAGLILAGCNYNMPREIVIEENTNTLNVNKELSEDEKKLLTDDPLLLSGTSEYKTIPCNGREVEVLDDATTNNFKFTGECKKVTVDGVSNTVTVEKVGEIVVKGISNKVIYSEGIDEKKPKITKTGVSTSVDSMQSVKDKKEADSKKQ